MEDKVYWLLPNQEPASSLAIGLVAYGRRQRHVGLLHRQDTGEALMLEVLDSECKNSAPEKKTLCIQPQLSPRRLLQISDICRLLWSANANKRIPFGFTKPDLNTFDPETFEYQCNIVGMGLTCASFVLAVFLRAGVNLIKMDEWQIRGEDLTWQLEYASGPASETESQEHVEALKKGIGIEVRFRPEEVAAASVSKELPASFDESMERAVSLLKMLYSPMREANS